MDHRLVSLMLAGESPRTVNIALNLRTEVQLRSYIPNKIKIISPPLGTLVFTWPHFAYSSTPGLVLAIISHFCIAGIEIQIKSASPAISGLGGSGSLAVSLIAGISKALELLGTKNSRKLSKSGMVWLGHHLEDALYHGTGLQDQAAAAYGGVNLWYWDYGAGKNKLFRKALKVAPSLENHIALGYTGRSHPTRGGSRVLNTLREKGERHVFVEMIKNAGTFARAIERGKFRAAGRCLHREGILREKLVGPYAPTARKLFEAANALHCGAKIPGRGGCAWAIGEKKDIEKLKQVWADILSHVPHAKLLPVEIDYRGLIVTY